MKTLFCAGLIVFGLASAQGATIGDFTQVVGATTPFSFTNNLGVSDTFSGVSVPVFFKFDSAAGPLPFGGAFRNAHLTISATSTVPGFDNGTNISETGFAGSFSIIDDLTLTNLLSGTFGTQATAGGPSLGNSANFGDATPPPGEVTFTSDYINFAPTINRAFSLSLSGLTNPLSLGAGGFINNTQGSSVGTFSADPLPTTGTPEPLTFGLIGSSLIGLALLRRRKVA